MRWTRRTGLVAALAVLCCLQADFANAQTKPSSPTPAGPAATTTGTSSDKTMAACQAMMNQCQRLQAEMKSQDMELEKLAADMNKAPENKKLDLLATVVTRLVNERKATHEEMLGMQSRMMQQVMQSGQGSMTQCPMMGGAMGGEKTALQDKGH